MSTSSGNDNHRLAVRGNMSQLLQRPGTVWTVESGSVAVFSVRVQNERPLGQRSYLFTCNRGDLLFGCDPALDELNRTFLVVGLEDSIIQEVAFDKLFDKTGLVAGEKKRVDNWIRRLCAAIADDAEIASAERFEAEEVELGIDQSLRTPPQSVRWLKLTEGAVQILGDPKMRIDAGSELIPISDDLWVTAEGYSVVQLQQTDDLASFELLEDGIKRLQQMCFAHVQLRKDADVATEAQRLDDRQYREEVETSHTLSQLSGTLHKHDSIPRLETDLLTALGAIGIEMGVEFKPPANSEDMRRVADPIVAVARASRVRIRNVVLTSNWWKQDCGPLLAYTEEEKRPVAIIRTRRFFGFLQYYELFDPKTMKRRRFDASVNDELSTDAVSFVRPMPIMKKASLLTLAKFGIGKYWLEAALILGLAISVTLLGMLTPVATRMIVDEAIPNANPRLLLEWGLGLFAIAIGSVALERAQGTFLIRLRTGATAMLQAAVFDRVLRLPSRFFRRFSSGDLMNRSMMVTEVSREISTTAINGILSGSTALLNLGLCYFYSAKLAWLAIGAALAVALMSVVLSFLIRTRALKLERLNGKLFGFAVQLVSGVSKLRVAGAEQRAFNNWALQYSEQLALINSIQRIQDWGSIINVAMRTGSMTLLFYFATKLLSAGASPASAIPGALLTMGTFLAFNSSFGTLIQGAVEASNTFVDIMDSWSKRKLMDPILTEPPEIDDGKVDPGRLTGEVRVEDVIFRYRPDGPLILDRVSIHVNPGEFIALVGPSGCGKSTIFKLLLGFEFAEAGSVFYDGQDLAGLDMTAVRRQIGVVLQSGYISAGSIFDSIASGNRLSLEEAWEAAKDAGFADDILEMPMAMHTMIPEGGSTLSGGQKQRLLIARALALNPKILLLDEATSALDNRTQEIVSRSVERRNVARIVVAHRLSTIQDADRIFVLDRGQVIENGTYQELVEADGLFKKMVSRQLT